MSPDIRVSKGRLLNKISTCNNSHDLTGCVVVSMNVISLNPSIDIDFAEEKCIEIICESELEFCEVNTGNMGLLLRLSFTVAI